MLAMLGFYIGDDLNRALDNLWYTLLFKRKGWYYRSRDDERTIRTGLGLFSNIMVDRAPPSLEEMKFLIRAVISTACFRVHSAPTRGVWPFRRLVKMLKGRSLQSDYIGWGWKEPNTHLLIQEFDRFFDRFKYIHVVRHGLDMAFSSNQRQLHNWGRLFGVKWPKAAADLPRASMRFWVEANRRAVQIGKDLGPDKFLLVNYDRICTTPEPELQKIIHFLGVAPDRETFDKLAALPKRSKRSGCYLKQDLSQFEPEDLSQLLSLGFGIADDISDSGRRISSGDF